MVRHFLAQGSHRRFTFGFFWTKPLMMICRSSSLRSSLVSSTHAVHWFGLCFPEKWCDWLYNSCNSICAKQDPGQDQKGQKSGKQGVQPKPQSLPRSRQCFLWECKKKCQKQTYGENCDSFFHIDLINVDVVVHLNQLYCAYGRFHNCRPSRCPRIRSCGAWFVPGCRLGTFIVKHLAERCQ